MGQPVWDKKPISTQGFPGGAYLNAISFTSSTRGWAVGSSGVIRRTTDGGTSWISATGGTNNNLWSVHMVDSLNGFAAGAAGTILKTGDGGQSWGATTSGTSSQINSIEFLTPLIGYAIANGGAVLKTVNGGTWSPQSVGRTTNLNRAHFLDANLGFIAGDTGAIFKTTDGGAVWSFRSVLSSGTKPRLNSVHFTSSAVGYAVGEYATGTNMNVAFKTTDSGISWTPMPMPTVPAGHMLRLVRVRFTSPNVGYITGNTLSGSSWSGVTLHTTNAGASWTLAFQPVQNVFDMSYSSDGKLFALADIFNADTEPASSLAHAE
jgi:photosystem II stability/assembly factor-like uncharacterized protein